MRVLHNREKEELKRILTQNGYGREEELISVLDAFLDVEAHLTVSEMTEHLRAKGLEYEPEFVQSALDLFCRYGLAQTKSFDGDECRYEHHHLGHHHDHLICTRCRKVEEFVDPDIEALQIRMAREKGFLPLQHRMEIYGLCSECAKDRGETVPLSEAEPGECVIVRGHVGGAEFQRRLTDMGLNPGVEIEVLNRNGGPLVVACRGSRMALGRGMSEKIQVTPVHGGGKRRRLRKRRR
ncbi:MAG: transcriptional repressor [Proteobacteria bacterium]|nr:transcriptional repressor [Pseudomonadota bacterium]